MSSFIPMQQMQQMQQPSARSRSLGLKLLVVFALILTMGIPALFVDSLVDERTKREGEVKDEISEHVGDPQTFLGPTLAIPYVIPASTPTGTEDRGIYFVFAQKGDTTIATTTEERHRSLFRVPVFHADVKMTGTFDLTGVPANAPANAQLDWSRAEIVVGVSDARGALADGTESREHAQADPVRRARRHCERQREVHRNGQPEVQRRGTDCGARVREDDARYGAG